MRIKNESYILLAANHRLSTCNAVDLFLITARSRWASRDSSETAKNIYTRSVFTGLAMFRTAHPGSARDSEILAHSSDRMHYYRMRYLMSTRPVASIVTCRCWVSCSETIDIGDRHFCYERLQSLFSNDKPISFVSLRLG